MERRPPSSISTSSATAKPSGADHVVEDQSAVFALLEDPATHGLHEPVIRIDTHGAAVFLAGEFAYKVKRAVFFPFMDFSTLEKRRAACEAEITVNGPQAAHLYLGVVPITKAGDGLALGGDGAPVDYAVKMRRFELDATLDRQVEKAPLSADLLTALAQAVAASHGAAPIRREADIPGAFAGYLSDNRAVFGADPALFPPEEADLLAQTCEAALARLAPLLRARTAEGFARRCHGDLHLRNIVLLDGRPVLFDAIEFNDVIATCDVLYDLAFLLMDLWQRGLKQEANTILNRYLWIEAEAHLDGLAAMPLFLSLRAAIRAKVEAAGIAHLSGEARLEAEARIKRFFRQALHFLRPDLAPHHLPDSLPGIPPGGPALVAVGGLSGSGKTTWALRTAAFVGRPPGAVIVRSDVERKRLLGAGETQKLAPEAYTPEVTARVYDRLRALARRVLTTGQSVIVDAVHAREEERAGIETVAREAGVPFHGVWLEAPAAVMKARVDGRHGDASDADRAVVERQLAYDLGDITWRRRQNG